MKIFSNCAKLELATNEKFCTAVSHETQDNQCQYASIVRERLHRQQCDKQIGNKSKGQQGRQRELLIKQLNGQPLYFTNMLFGIPLNGRIIEWCGEDESGKIIPEHDNS